MSSQKDLQAPLLVVCLNSIPNPDSVPDLDLPSYLPPPAVSSIGKDLFNLFLALAILASLNLFLTVSSISIASTANLTSLVFLTPFGFLVQFFCARFSLSDLYTEFLNFLIFQGLSSTCLQDLILMLLSQLVSVLLLHVLAAIASSSVCDECAHCQLLFAKQLPSRSKTPYAMRVVASSSSRQTSFADPIPNTLPL